MRAYITADDACCAAIRSRFSGDWLRWDAALHPGPAVIAVEDNKSEAIAILRRHLPDWPGVELAVLPTRYPQGRRNSLSSRYRPAGAAGPSCLLCGCAVFNAGTVAAVYRAVYEASR